jgi:hypothetical protein
MNDKEKGLWRALESFLSGGDFAQSVASSVRAGWGGGAYFVELFPDGHYRVLWQIGNKYVSPGVILSIPTLASESAEVHEDFSLEEVVNFYSGDIKKEMRQKLSYALDRVY